MADVYFGKMNTFNAIEDKLYRTGELQQLGNMQVGDFAFIKFEHETSPASVKRFWRLKEIKEEDGLWKAYFDEIFEFNQVPLLKFESLSFFKLDIVLLNKCNKQTKGLSFYKLGIVDKAVFEQAVSSVDVFNSFIANPDNYRKMLRLPDIASVNYNSIDVQFYKEDDTWQLPWEMPFYGQDLKDNFDASQYDLYDKIGKKGTNTAKDKMYSFLSGNDIEASLMGIWDLFCGTVKENVSSDKKKKKTIKREDFIDYCKKNEVKRAASVYEGGIRSMEKEMERDVDVEYDKDHCKQLISDILAYADTFDKDAVGNRRNWHLYVNKYVEYKDSLIKPDSSSESELSSASEPYSYSKAKHNGINKVYYGTPGCGKSYYVDNEVLAEEDIDDNNVFRVTFYQDYTNADFVGQILPKVDGDKVFYEFVPGPFANALKCAIDNSDDKVALIIEELNRGNAPSIFGDIFQLLDRKNGESQYKIQNENIQAFLKKESTYDLDYIKIPSNLYIFATMNTSDQNVFTLDTAFKRRWKFEKITNDFLPKDTIGAKLVPGLQNVTWKTFVETINKFIVSHATSLSSEDKQLGKYFVDEELLMDKSEDYSDDKTKDFAYKVFEYLWADVAKFNRQDWFDSKIQSLDMLIKAYLSHMNIFSSDLLSELPIYTPLEEEE
ncbi:MAG: AAA family ATPase [Lachnospiraceae bacterium]|nr:AAA family ATPase [Lachnospiraceae bacterium]